MKRFYIKFRILLLTFALGLASVQFFRTIHERWTLARIDVPQIESDAPLIVKPYAPRNETPVGNRDLSLYEFGGTFSYCINCSETEDQKSEIERDKARAFIWKNRNAQKRCYIIVASVEYTKSGKRTKNEYIFIEPNLSGTWHLVIRSETNASLWEGRRFSERGVRYVTFWRFEDKKLRLWFVDESEGYGVFSI